MISKFIINGRVLQDLVVPQQERTGKEGFYTISGMLSYNGKEVQFLACKTMGLRATQKVKPINKEKSLFKGKDFRDVFRLRYDQDYVVVIKSDVIEVYHTPEKNDNRVLVAIQGGEVL